jgi:hypothetical protein
VISLALGVEYFATFPRSGGSALDLSSGALSRVAGPVIESAEKNAEKSFLPNTTRVPAPIFDQRNSGGRCGSLDTDGYLHVWLANAAVPLDTSAEFAYVSVADEGEIAASVSA